MLVKIKKMSESEKGVFLAAGIIVSIFLVSGVCFLRACGILPYTRRWFISYNAFYQQADRVVAPYPSVLPASAEDIKYFYHTGWLDKKTGISFTVSDEDYQKIKEVYLSSYKTKANDYQRNHQDSPDKYLSEYGHNPDKAADDWMYVFNEKLTYDFLEEEGLEYLGKVFRDAADHYIILAYIGDDEGGERCNLEGVFCNDETNKVVMFGFTDVFRKSRK